MSQRTPQLSADDGDDPRSPHAGWPWRSWGCEAMTHQRATAEAVYAVSMAQAAMRGKLFEFEQGAKAMLLPTSEIYRRRPQDWAA